MPTEEKSAAAPAKRRARLFRNGRNQAVRIPRDFEFQGDEVFLRREDGLLILEPIPKRSRLLEVLGGLKEIDEKFPDVDAGLQPLDDVGL